MADAEALASRYVGEDMQQEVETQLRAEVHALRSLVMDLISHLAMVECASTAEAMARIVILSKEVMTTIRQNSLEAGSNEIATRAEELVEKLLERAKNHLPDGPESRTW